MRGIQRTVDVRRARKLWALADRLTPKRGFREFNYAVLDFTIMVCGSSSPDSENSPVSHYCAMYRNESELESRDKK